MKRSAPLRRNRMAARVPLPGRPAPPARRQRDWTEANRKLAAERGRCRVGRHLPEDCQGPVQRAHVTPRRLDAHLVDARDIVPLCLAHHDRYDGRAPRRLDLLPYLTVAEQARAVERMGGLMAALVHLTGEVWRR